MRSVASLIVVLGSLLLPTGASASGSYRCCLIDKTGDRYVYQSRASSRFKGTIADLCVNAAREQKATRCNAASSVDLSYNFVKGRQGFEPDQQPEHANVFTRCEAKRCVIGITAQRAAKVTLTPRNSAKCQLSAFPAPKDLPGAAAYTLVLALTPGKANACVLDIGGKSTTFFSDIAAGD